MRISNAMIHQLLEGMSGPKYDRASLRQGIVHMSVGGFHRAHAAVYLDDLMSKYGVRDWAICGIGLLPSVP